MQNDAKFDGVFYTCVKTTNIYCRPSCRAKRPDLKNVVYVRSRREAERAGYRACKVCFPQMPEERWTYEKGTMRLSVEGEFSLSEALMYLTRSSEECLHRVVGDTLLKLLEIDGERVLIEVGSKPDADGETVEIRFRNGIPKESIRMAAAHYVWEWLDLERDLAPFYRMAGDDPLLKKVVDAHRGLRIVRIPDLFEALCWAVIGQQINLVFAYTLKKRLVERYGERMEWEGETYWLFPVPERIAELTMDELRALQFTGKKAEYLIEVARQIATKSLTKEGLLALSGSEAEQAMLKIRGIGPWTASYVAMRCLGDASAFPVGDAGLQNAIKKQLGMDRKPTREEMMSLAQGWEGWQAYATFYLWRSLAEGN
ncbi:DNA glycosylase [Tumebacillus sp. DT12]|uniref:DNA-3-methyladenine glycosylase II n=2 Tax=Tumebacillus lacus TaxID=2995335 RepID=A0ABT3X2H5_9BACL|nr:DNA glycosylase [Tumebacillus lacus]